MSCSKETKFNKAQRDNIDLHRIDGRWWTCTRYWILRFFLGGGAGELYLLLDQGWSVEFSVRLSGENPNHSDMFVSSATGTTDVWRFLKTRKLSPNRKRVRKSHRNPGRPTEEIAMRLRSFFPNGTVAFLGGRAIAHYLMGIWWTLFHTWPYQSIPEFGMSTVGIWMDDGISRWI